MNLQFLLGHAWVVVAASCALMPTASVFAEDPASTPGVNESDPDTSCCDLPAGRFGMIAAAAQTATGEQPAASGDVPEAPAGMVWIPAGEFTMGTDAPDTWPNEHPAHRVRVDGFWMDQTEVTNAQFAAFVEATGYLTVAERPVDWQEMKKQLPPGTPKPADEVLQPGSLVFTPPDHAVPLHNIGAWWTWTNFADWRHPAGPGSSIEGKDDYPVVHIAWQDAKAYADWAGKQLPTEAQWEYAAKGGRDASRFAWGDTFRPEGKIMANTWDGQFPHRNTQDDGHVLAAPVKSFPPNGYGLYDTAGNVWEWTADLYRDDRNAVLARRGLVENPTGPNTAADAANPRARSRVIKGGSFLCHVDYCESYRPSARRGTPDDTGLQHTGFRCVLIPAVAKD